MGNGTSLVEEVSLSVAVLNFVNEHSFAAQFYKKRQELFVGPANVVAWARTRVTRSMLQHG